ncbi:MAG: helix-turn-helix domain-containing protein [Agathobaculum sp.]|jgi:transcriptional regulator with XRE-family HTH domain|uniref:helix-turn-helix domain-containing protein n=1 Tax=Agathobaculum sp. TaxID=2048138 RepID=UPI003D8CBE44
MELPIGNIIMQARRAKGLTQEALADMVGVSAAAVSKWETASSYPDITLLPPLARALGMTTDELLDFHTAPTNEELHALSSRLSRIFDEQGFDAGCAAAEQLLREYPSCGSLKLTVGGLYYRYIASALNSAADTTQAAEAISAHCLALFEQGEQQCAESGEKLMAKSLRINMLTMLGRYGEAEALIDSLPQKLIVDPEQLRLGLHLAQDRLEQADQLAHRALLTHLGETSAALMSLTTISRRSGDFTAAHRYVQAYRALDALFGMDTSNGLLLEIMLAQDEGNNEQMLDLFEQYVDVQINRTLDYRGNPYFSDVQTHTPSANELNEMRQLALRAIEEDERYAPVRHEPRFLSALDRLRAALPG